MVNSPPRAVDAPLPLPLERLVEFAFEDPLTASLAHSSCNSFFQPFVPDPTSGPRDGYIDTRRGPEGCWDRLPTEWTTYFDQVVDPSDRARVLRDLANAHPSPEFPPSLREFLSSCRTLSFDRTCSDVPILSYPPRPSHSPTPNEPAPSDPIPTASSSRTTTDGPTLRGDAVSTTLKGKAKARHTNAQRAGESPKKRHEVVEFCRLVRAILDEDVHKAGKRSITHCVDVGSGRAHLSRALASSPLDLHVLALDWSSSQKSGAERLDQIRQRAELNPLVGSLTHRVSALDRQGVRNVLHEWPPVDSTVQTEDGELAGERGPHDVDTRDPPLLVALHACGDLTPDAIKAFVDYTHARRSSRRPSRSTSDPSPVPLPPPPPPRAVFVGCCYNLQTPSDFPYSTTLRALLSSPRFSTTVPRDPMTLSHLRLTPQSPPTWHASPASTRAFETATLKLAHRARFEVELEVDGYGTEVGERKVGRVPECRDWPEYRLKAVQRLETYSTGPNGDKVDRSTREPEPIPFGPSGGRAMDAGGSSGSGTEPDHEWDRAVFQLRVFWTLRSWVGPPLESLCVLDRWFLLVEGLRLSTEPDSGADADDGAPGQRVEMVNLFDQGTGSLRNLALVVR
ncbi:hypothetical protein JCM10212_005069 [Sporobolomyces blumeae]